MNKYYLVFGIRKCFMHEYYSVFGIQKIFMNIYYSVFRNSSWTNMLGIRYSKIFHERMIFGIRSNSLFGATLLSFQNSTSHGHSWTLMAWSYVKTQAVFPKLHILVQETCRSIQLCRLVFQRYRHTDTDTSLRFIPIPGWWFTPIPIPLPLL